MCEPLLGKDVWRLAMQKKTIPETTNLHVSVTVTPPIVNRMPAYSPEAAVNVESFLDTHGWFYWGGLSPLEIVHALYERQLTEELWDTTKLIAWMRDNGGEDPFHFYMSYIKSWNSRLGDKATEDTA